jgi:hypothetical protein
MGLEQIGKAIQIAWRYPHAATCRILISSASGT